MFGVNQLDRVNFCYFQLILHILEATDSELIPQIDLK